MEENGSKYGKYIVTELAGTIHEAAWSPVMPIAGEGKSKGGRVLFLDSEVVPGAFYVDTVWNYAAPGEPQRMPVGAHKHDYDEVVGLFGTDLDDPHELNGEIELWLGDEKHVLTKSCLVFIPAGLSHCPLRVVRTDKPIFEFTTYPGKLYEGSGR